MLKSTNTLYAVTLSCVALLFGSCTPEEEREPPPATMVQPPPVGDQVPDTTPIPAKTPPVTPTTTQPSPNVRESADYERDCIGIVNLAAKAMDDRREECRERHAVWADQNIWIDIRRQGEDFVRREDFDAFYKLPTERREVTRRAMLALITAWCYRGSNIGQSAEGGQVTESALLKSRCVESLPTMAALGLEIDTSLIHVSIPKDTYSGEISSRERYFVQ